MNNLDHRIYYFITFLLVKLHISVECCFLNPNWLSLAMRESFPCNRKLSNYNILDIAAARAIGLLLFVSLVCSLLVLGLIMRALNDFMTVSCHTHDS